VSATQQIRVRRSRALLGVLGCGLLAAGVHVMPRVAPDARSCNSWLRAARARLRGARLVETEGVVFQEHGNDCGAACLKTILAERGIERSLSHLRKTAGTTRAGTSMRNLRLAAEGLGVESRSWLIAAKDLASLPLPAIAFVNGNHFVVLRRHLARDLLEVDDPALGRLQWPISSFRRAWEGQVLVFAPTWVPP
jgi:predicted double-glycine peptidase